jgi:hypothetical protein
MIQRFCNLYSSVIVGFSREEAEALTEMMSEVIAGVMDSQNKIVVTKPQQV